MSFRKYLIAGVVAACGLSADRASAQVTLGPAGVTFGGSGGRSVVVPYSGVRDATVVGPRGAYTPSTGTAYSPAYNTPFGGTSYYSPQSGNFFNPNYGTYSAPTAPVSPTYSGYGYPAAPVSPNYGGYGYPAASSNYYGGGYTAPVYGPAPATSFGGVPVGGFRIR